MIIEQWNEKTGDKQSYPVMSDVDGFTIGLKDNGAHPIQTTLQITNILLFSHFAGPLIYSHFHRPINIIDDDFDQLIAN